MPGAPLERPFFQALTVSQGLEERGRTLRPREAVGTMATDSSDHCATRPGPGSLRLARHAKQRVGGTGLWHSLKAACAFVLACVILALLPSRPALAAMPPAGSTLGTRAVAELQMPDDTAPQRIYSNAVTVVIAGVDGVNVSGGGAFKARPGAAVSLPFLVTNTGNIASTLRLQALGRSAGCPAPSVELGGLKLVEDRSNGGVADPAAPAVESLALEPGRSAALLLLGTLPAAGEGTACVSVEAMTAVQGASSRATASVSVGVDEAAILNVVDSVLASGDVEIGSTLGFTVRATNPGAKTAQPAATDGATTATTLRINGVPTRALLLRNPIPPGTHYVAGSLGSSDPGAIKLFRLPGDPPFTYRTAEDASAVEVAIAGGQPGRLASGNHLEMSFQVAVTAAPGSMASVSSQGFAHYNDGSADVVAAGNVVNLRVASRIVGVALAASDPTAVSPAVGKVHMTAVVRNYGADTLYDLQLRHPLEAAAGLGSYTSASVPGPAQYTVVPGSISVTNVSDSAAIPQANTAYDGRGGNGTDGLFTKPVALRAGGQIVIEYDVLLNFTGWSSARTTQATATAARLPGGAPVITDLSQSGIDPAAGGAGPQQSNAPTPVSVMPLLTLQKAVTSVTRLAANAYEITYRFTISNVGRAEAPRLRILDNLECAASQAGIASWRIVSPPTAANGVLVVSPAYTGRGSCSTAVDPSGSAAAAAELSITDGSRSLAPGESEVITMTVGVTVPHSGTLFVNTALATTQSSTGAVSSVGSTSATAFLVDPQGIVYDSATRQPLAGAVVTLTRGACSVGAGGPILPDEVYNSAASNLSFNADGSVSYTTNASGEYQFYWKSPPLQSLCTYSVKVTPPADYAVSTAIPAQKGSFGSCGAIVPNASAPVEGKDATTWYASFVSGFDPAAAKSCEVVHNHIPLDSTVTVEPQNPTPLQLQKQGDKARAELGDFLTYQLTVVNRSSTGAVGVKFVDTLPPGLAYVPGSARFNGTSAPDPEGGKGPVLTFDFPAVRLADGGSAVLQYRVRVGVGAPADGVVTNSAVAYTRSLRSNLARFSTHITGGAFSGDAFAIGKVYLDCNRNGGQDDAEPGIPGVRLYTEDGRAVVTDLNGRWSLFGLKPLTHVVRLDESTLPKDAELQAFANRNAGDARSRFLDVRNGELAKADFQVVSCTDDIQAEVERRRKLLQAKGEAAEIDAAMSTRLSATPSVSQPGDLSYDPRTGAASGSVTAGAGGSVSPGVSAAANANSGGALIALPRQGAVAGPAAGPASLRGAPAAARPVEDGARAKPESAAGADLLGPIVAPGAVALETLVEQADAALGFLDLQDNDTVAHSVFNVRVKGPLGSSLKLWLNGHEVGERRVGKRASLQSKGIVAWEYIGVELQPGGNELKVEAVDEFGVSRAERSIRVRAPGGLARLRLEPQGILRADPQRPITLVLTLTDAQGVPVTARTPITLESDQGAWLAENLNPGQPGVHINVTGGRAELRYRPPADPGLVRLRVSAYPLAEDINLRLLPQDRPLQGIGLVEGTIDLTRRGGLTLGSTPAGAAFEQELTSHGGGSPDARIGSRAALYFKGTILGEYLLTTAYDSNKAQADRLFRDIRPDEYYPVYGDSAERSYDAQSSGKLYVRIDKNRSYLLLGDFNTASSEEVRKISQTSRVLNGIKSKVETDDLRVSSFVSHDSTTQQVEELPATGLALYAIGRSASIVSGSERVEVISRLRSSPQVIVGTRTLARGSDYSFEPLDGRLLLAQPLASVDADLNPQSLRVSYEVSGGGPQFTVAGIDAQVKVGEKLQLGAVVSRDQNPQNRRDLNAVTALATVGDAIVVAGEYAQSRSDLKGSGNAQRLSATYQDGKLTAQAEAQRTSTGFDNPSGGVGPGNQQATYKADYALDDSTKLRLEGSRSVVQPQTAGGAAVSQQSYTLAVQKKLGADVAGSLGLVRGSSSGTGAFNYGSLGTDAATGAGAGSGLTALGAGSASNTMLQVGATARVAALPQAQVFGVLAQDVRASDQREASLGASYALTDKTRIFARYDYLSAAALQATVNGGQKSHGLLLGVDSAYMEGGRLYNQARLGPGGVQNSTGVRNTLRLGDAWSLTGSLERTAQTVGTSGTATAATLGTTYAAGPWRGNAAVEYRTQSDGASSSLYSLGAAYKLSPDWALLARGIATRTGNSGGQGAHTLDRQQIGFAWRPAERNDLNGLLRVETRQERLDAAAASTSGSAAPAFDSTGNVLLPGNYRTAVLTGLVNYNPRADLTLTGRYAAKHARFANDTGTGSYWAQLIQSRLTQDLTSRWDLGVQAGLMVGQGGARQSTAGVEIGYQVVRNLWVSAGYNFVGLKDADLAGNDYTSRGAYLRLRAKFDETGFSFSDDAGSPKARHADRTRGAAAADASAAAAAALVRAEGAQPWWPDAPLQSSVALGAVELFEASPSSAVLTAEGRTRLEALFRQLAKDERVRHVLISVGHGDVDQLDTAAWAARAAAIRNLARKITAAPRLTLEIAVDSHSLPELAAEEGDPVDASVFRLNVIAAAAEGARAASAGGSAQ